MTKPSTPARKVALQVVRRLREKGFTAYFAGGCVRDEMLGRIPQDYDVATNARPEQVEALFPKTVAVGKSFGVIAVIDGDITTEVATFRKDHGYQDGRRPDSISFCAAREDALRRDFTINGLFYDPIEDRILDYVGGIADIERKVVRAIGDPHRRFAEDHLRMLRAVRFTHTLEFRLDPETEEAIRQMAPLITKISAERIEQELSRIFTEAPRPGGALRHLLRLGLLAPLLPEVAALEGVEQPPEYHPEGDVFTHTALMLDLMGADRPWEKEPPPAYTPRELAWTVLLHDIGKAVTASVEKRPDGTERIRFNAHAARGAEMAEAILTRLRFPAREKKRIVEVIRGHMRFMDVRNMREATLRRLIASDTFDLEMELHRLDCLASHRKLDNYRFVLEKMEAWSAEPVLPEPWVKGRDLIELGLRPGPIFSRILSEALDAQMEGRFSDKEALLKWIREKYPPNGEPN